MSNLFNVSEVIDMGIEKEKKRRDFYGRAAEKFEQKDLKELFVNLKNWEELHINKFTEIRNNFKELETTDSYKGELKDYIGSLIDDRIYDKVSADGFDDNVKTPLDAIDYGIGFEKDAILFFNEMLKYTEPGRKDIIQKLIDEEKQHIVYLSEMRNRI